MITSEVVESIGGGLHQRWSLRGSITTLNRQVQLI